MERRVFDKILSRIKHGGLVVTYWDGATRTFGTAKPYFHLYIKSPATVRAIIKNMSLGFAESYANGNIEVEGELIDIGRLVAENHAAFSGLSKLMRLTKLSKNTRSKQKSYIAHHYDLGNDFYKLWLDTGMTYSCAYYKSPKDTLETAQQQKVEYILKKLRLQSGHTLLDIGSGWGTLLITAAKKYGVHGLGVTLSEKQLARSRKAAKIAGVQNKISFELVNYQELPKGNATFDRIVSVGMFEHVGKGNHAQYYSAVDRLLKPNGLSLLHTITQQTEEPNNPWIDKYIFPGGYIPSNREIVAALPGYNFRLTDYENLRIHYAMTLEEWQRRYKLHRKKIIKMFDEYFFRMWNLWLASSAAGFRYGELDLSQYVFTKGPQNKTPLTRDFLYR